MGSKPRLHSRIDGPMQRLRHGGSDFVYSLIQPQQIPDRPKPPPRLRVEILISVLGLLGWVLFLSFYDRVSPEASLDLRYSRQEITQIAEDYVQGRGVDLENYHRVVTFGSDGMAQIYLERTVGIDQLQQLVRDKQVPVWTWHVRWFVPEQHEEYNAYLLPTGELAGYSRALSEETPGLTVSPAEAQRLAEEYLIDDQGLELEEWKLYDMSAETLPNRTDHTLTWMRQGLDTGEGDVRVSVVVQGDKVGYFRTWFRVPEAFSRAYHEQRSRAYLLDDLASSLALLFLFGGGLVVFWGLVTGLRIGWLPIVTGLIAGLVDLLASLNWLPLIEAGYNTAVDYRTYILGRLATYASNALFVAVSVAFLVLAGQWLLRAVWPRQHKFKPDPRAPWSQLARSGWRGIMVGGLMGAYLIAFYTLAQQLGAWSPIRTPSLDLLATPLPFIAAVWLGLLPALTEELTYRALGIGLTMRVTGGLVWLSLLVPSLLWGFAHASYLTDPIGLRGIELTLSSLLFTGLFFLLFDLTTSIVAHYTYNASLYALILVRSGNTSLLLTGLAAALLGLLPAAILIVRRLSGHRRRLPPALTIRAGGEEDWARVQALAGEPLGRMSEAEQLICIEAANGQLQGYAVGAIASPEPEARTGIVKAIYVDESLRGQYYGTALYRALAEWFHEMGVDRIQAAVSPGNAGASTFWSMQRFRPWTRLWMNKPQQEGT